MEKLEPAQVLAELERRLGVTFADPALGLSALTHKSYVNEHKELGPGHNERLEFLGDAVVELAISHRLMEQFPQSDEGELSRLRALLVNEEGLAKVARALKLGELLLLGRGEDRTGGRDKSSLLSDALEAVIGAVYLGAGLPAVMAVVDRLFATSLEGVADGKNGLDHKTRLQELAQTKLRAVPRYRVVSEIGPDHAKSFEVEVVLGDGRVARATGRNKKDAEQAAAQKMLALLAADGDAA